MNAKSIWAVLAGVFFVVGVTTAVDVVLHVAGVYPSGKQPLSDSLALLATAYRVVISVAGAYLTAKLAPFKPMKHVMILGLIGLVLGLGGVAATWNAGLGPRWYPIALAALAIPQCWAGGKLHEALSHGASAGSSLSSA